MMKFHLGFENTGVYEEGFGIPAINSVLIFSAAGVTFFGLVYQARCNSVMPAFICMSQYQLV